MGDLPAGWVVHWEKRLKRFVVITEKGVPLVPSSVRNGDEWRQRVIEAELARRKG